MLCKIEEKKLFSGFFFLGGRSKLEFKLTETIIKKQLRGLN